VGRFAFVELESDIFGAFRVVGPARQLAALI
jgi:hypothetical protein